MEGRRRRAILRTSATVPSASLRMASDVVAQLGRELRGDQGGKIAKGDEQGGEGLADMVVEFAGDGAAFVLLGGDEAGGELLQFLASASGFFEPCGGIGFESEDPGHAEGGEKETETECAGEHGGEAPTELREEGGDTGVALG